MKSPRVGPVVVAAIIIVVVLFGIRALTNSDDGSPPPQFHKVTVKEPGPDVTVQADRDHQYDPGESTEAVNGTLPGNPATVAPGSAANAVTPDVHEDMVDEGAVPGVPAKVVRAGKIRSEQLAKRDRLPPVQPAGAQNYSCPAAPVVNQSALTESRKGVALHFTVSAPGSLLSIRSLFNTPSFGASSNYGFEPYNQRCQQWVPDNRKAWAQLSANSAYISIEIMTFDRTRAEWLDTTMLKTGSLAALVRDKARAVGAPLRLVDPVGCTWLMGITDHDRLECGNTHYDVGKNFPWDVFMAQVRRGVHVASKAARKMCRSYNLYRKVYLKYKTRQKQRKGSGPGGHLGAYGKARLALATRRKNRAVRYFVKNHDKGKTNYDCLRNGTVTVRVL